MIMHLCSLFAQQSRSVTKAMIMTIKIIQCPLPTFITHSSHHREYPLAVDDHR
jgi:hypothetical protein